MLTPPVNNGEGIILTQAYCCVCKNPIGKSNKDLPAINLVNMEFQDTLTSKWHNGRTLICILCLRNMLGSFEAMLAKLGRKIIDVTPMMINPKQH